MKSLDQILEEYRKRKKANLLRIRKAGELPVIRKIPTGILVFDYLTGGGMPVGHITELTGDYSSGKTTLSYIAANQFLKTFPDKEVLFLNFEEELDKSWALTFIEDEERFKVVDPTYGEEGLDLIISLVEKEAPVSLFIIDSLTAITPAAEFDGDMSDQQVGLQARLLAKFFRKFVVARAKSESDFTLLMTNQVRAKIGRVGYGPTSGPGSGYAHGHFTSLMVKTYKKETIKQADIPVRQNFAITIEKTKVGGFPKRSAEYSLCLLDHESFLRGEPYELKTIMAMLKGFKILVKEKGKYSLAGREFRTQVEVEEALKEDRDFRRAAKALIYEKLGGANVQG